MRFRRLEARVFGVLRGRRLELPPEAVLVFGSNESGKSTFRRALETILSASIRPIATSIRSPPGTAGRAATSTSKR